MVVAVLRYRANLFAIIQEETASHSLAEIERSSVTFQKYLFVGFLLISLFSKDERSRDVSGLMELDGKVHVGNLHRVGCRVQACCPLWKAALDPAGLQGGPIWVGTSFRDAVQWPVHGASLFFGHRYLQILFFRARLIKREPHIVCARQRAQT